MELVLYSEAALGLTEALECDPDVMKELGGPVPREDIPRIHRKRLEHVAKGAWHFAILPDGEKAPVGTVSLWESVFQGAKINEMGWSVLPAFQGRGLATAAAKMLIERAKAVEGFGAIHAFPSLTNGPSNAICRKLGFSPLEECDLDYAGRPLRCRHWKLDLPPSSRP